MSRYESISRPFYRRIDAERAHGFGVAALRARAVLPIGAVRDPRLSVDLLGLRFPNPIGMAAGFDKNAEVPDQLLRLGFGFTEVGTLTPKPQQGNPKPRVFRLTDDRAVINRLGFNNDGHAAALARLSRRAERPGIVAVNVGANKDSEDRIADYVDGIRTFASVASYFTINVSSPNTPGLRDLQAREALDELLGRSLDARDALAAAHGRRVPVLLKIAPDLTREGLEDVAEVSLSRGVDGMIVSNTTLARPGLTDPQREEQGGMSGVPLMHRSTVILARMRQLVGPAFPLIGVGGVLTGEDALEKLRAGANLVQLYTGFVYRGPRTAMHVNRELLRGLDRLGAGFAAEVTGSGVTEWADKPLA
jgi:dihydroorotate dehydrogenase